MVMDELEINRSGLSLKQKWTCLSFAPAILA